MRLDRPIIIVSTGRSGSTIFHQILAQHPQLMWISGIAARWPQRPQRNAWGVMNYRSPLVGGLLQRLIVPSESYAFWDYYTGGAFSTPYRDLQASDLTPYSQKRLLQAFEAMVNEKKPRLMLKITGWSRIGYLQALFGQAKFIHIIRDGRAVTNSMLNVGFWKGWGGTAKWRSGELTPEQQVQWDANEQSFVALAAIQWDIYTQAVRQAAAMLPTTDYLLIRYEQLCAEPLATMRQVTDFCDIPFTSPYEHIVEGYNLRNNNDRWRTDLTPDQQNILASVLHEPLQREGYAPDV